MYLRAMPGDRLIEVGDDARARYAAFVDELKAPRVSRFGSRPTGQVATLEGLRSRYPDQHDEDIVAALEAVSGEAGVRFDIRDGAVWVRP